MHRGLMIVVVEQTQFDSGCIGRVHGEANAIVESVCAQRKGRTRVGHSFIGSSRQMSLL